MNQDETIVIDIPLDQVRPGVNFRKRFDGNDMAELTESVRRVGVLQPVLVTPVPDAGAHYILVSGERRYRAAKAAGLTTIPAVVRDLSEREAREIALIENLHRRDLTPIEEARGYKALIEECGLKQEEVAERVGVSQPQVSNRLRLLKLPEKVQALIEDGTLHAGHGLALLRYLPDGRVYEPFFPAVLDEFLKNPAAINTCESQLREVAYWKSKPLGRDYGVAFDASSCSACPAALGFQMRWEKEEHKRCINTSCWEAKQAIALGEREAARRDSRQVGPSGERVTTDPDYWKKQQEEARAKEQEKVEKIQRKVKKIATTAAAIPDACLVTAKRLRDLARPHWKKANYLFDRECYLELAQLLLHFKQRSEVAPNAVPAQFGAGTLLIPAQGITIQGGGYGPYGNCGITLDPLTFNWGHAKVEDSKATGPVYYRCAASLRDGLFRLHQLAVLPCQTRDVVLVSNQAWEIKQGKIPELAGLVMALPAFPTLDEESSDAPAPADMNEPAIPDEDKSFDELPEDDEAFDEEIAAEDADRICPINDQPVTDEICSECAQWDDEDGCLKAGQEGAPEPASQADEVAAAAPAETPPDQAVRSAAPADEPDDGKRRCPLWSYRPVMTEEECRAWPGCDQYDETVEGHCKLIAAERAKKGEVA